MLHKITLIAVFILTTAFISINLIVQETMRSEYEIYHENSSKFSHENSSKFYHENSSKFYHENNSKFSQHFHAFFNCQLSAKHTPDNWNGEEIFCNASFDGIGCWNAALPNSSVKIDCPNYISDSKAQNLAERRCLLNGSWEINWKTGKDEGDYSDCNFTVRIPNIDEVQLVEILEMINQLDVFPYANSHTKQAFEACIDDVLLQKSDLEKSENRELFCPKTFDGWGCWNDTLSNETAYIHCPPFIPGFSPENFAHKICTENGTWYKHFLTNKTWSNYTECIDRVDLEFRQMINILYITGYSISVIALLISLAIFFSFKIIWYHAIVNQPNVLVRNGLDCQILHVLVHFFLVCNYFWMLCEGLYLHTLLVVAFVSEDKILKWFYLLGWIVPIPLTVIYTILRSNSPEPRDTGYCWIDESIYTWLLSGPVCMSLLLNLFFLINIVRVLVTKMRAVNSPDTHHTRKAVRATLILIPLLGLHYVIVPFRPETKSAGELIYEIVGAVVTSLQGLCVAMLFCFCNGEVIGNLKKKWSQMLLRHGIGDRRMSYAATTVSYMPKIDDTKEQKDTM